MVQASCHNIMSTRQNCYVALEPFIVRKNGSVQLLPQIVKNFRSAADYSIGLAFTFRQTSWLQPALSEFYDDPNVLAWIGKEPERDEQEKIINYLVAISYRSHEFQQLIIGLWMVAGVIVTDLELIGPAFDPLLYVDNNEKNLQDTAIRGVLTVESAQPEEYFCYSCPNEHKSRVNLLLPLRELTEKPRNASKFVRNVLRETLLTSKRLNGLKTLVYFQTLCSQIQSPCIGDMNQLWQLTVQKAVRQSIFQVKQDLKPQLQQIYLSPEPLNRSLELRLLLLRGIMKQLNITQNLQLSLPEIPKEEMFLNLQAFFQRKFSTESEFVIFQRQFNLSVRKIQEYKPENKGGSTRIQPERNSIIQKLEPGLLQKSQQSQETEKTTRQSEQIQQSQSLQSYHESIARQQVHCSKHVVESVQALPIYQQIFTADRLYAFPSQTTTLCQHSVAQPCYMPAASARRKVFECCSLI